MIVVFIIVVFLLLISFASLKQSPGELGEEIDRDYEKSIKR